MRKPDTNDETTALAALGWTLADPSRAARLLDLTGLTPDTLRGAVGERATLAAVLAFLEGHEADLTACADALGLPPADLVATRARLEGGAA